MSFPDDKYNFNSTYILNNGYYIDFKTVGSKNTPIVKTPEGAIWYEGESSFSSPAKILVNTTITHLFNSLEDPNLEIINIITKTSLPTKNITNSIKVVGKVADKDGNPIQGVDIKPMFFSNPPPQDSFPSDEGSVSNVNIETQNNYLLPTKAQKTDELGNFVIEYNGDKGINFNQSYIEISKKEYFPKSIGPKLVKTGIQNRPNVFEGESTLINLYELGKIILSPSTLDLKKEEAKLKTDLQKREDKLSTQLLTSQLGLEARLAKILFRQKERIKENLIVALIRLISIFGSKVLHGMVTNKKNALNDKICPSKEKLLETLKKRNKIVRELNNIYKIVRTISKVLKIVNAVILGVKIGMTIAQALTAIPFSYNALIEKGFKELDKLLEKAGIAVTILSVLAASVGMVLGVMIDLLNKLDTLFQECAEELNQSSTSLEGEKISFEELNKEFANFIDEDSNKPLGSIDPLTNKPYPYRGFTFEIKDDISQDFKFPKRYAIARNMQGIQVLRSESSFASGPEILIEELKFIIDRDNLKAN